MSEKIEQADLDVLALCPFCGCRAKVHASSRLSWARCKNCHCEGPVRSSEAEATEAWNTRDALSTSVPAPSTDAERLRDANLRAFDAAKAFIRDDRTPISTKLTATTPGLLTALHDAILGAILADRAALAAQPAEGTVKVSEADLAVLAERIRYSRETFVQPERIDALQRCLDALAVPVSPVREA